MKNNRVRFNIILTLIFSIILTGFIVSFAEEFEGDTIPAEEHAPKLNSNEVQEEIEKQNKISEEYFNNKRTQGIGILSSGSRRLSVPLRQQQNSYYCGPASVQMTILQLRGSSPSQQTLANNMGTNSSNGTYVYRVAQELQKYTSYQYTTTSSSSYSSDLIYSIDKGKPMIAHVRASSLPHSPGAGAGHYIVNTGYMWGMSGSSAVDRVYYNDPHYNNNYYGSYYCTWSQMIKAINDRAGYYIRGQ